MKKEKLLKLSIYSLVLITLFSSISSINTHKVGYSKLSYYNDYSDYETKIHVCSRPFDITNVTELEGFLDGVMNDILEDYKIPGATIAVVKDNKTFLSKGYGLANIEENIKVDPDETMFRIGSVSKLFTYTAIMQLWEQGLINLDDDVNDYLTEFKIPKTFSQPITFNHLMTHTAGFEEQIFGLWGINPITPETLAKYCSKYIPTRVSPPGKVASYSNYGVALLGYIVEVVSGVRFEEYIEENIFKPLNMNHSTFLEPVPSELVANLSIGYDEGGDDGTFEAQDFEMVKGIPAGAMSSTASDMANFMIAHLHNGSFEGSQIIQESTAQLMYTRSYTPDPRLNGVAHGWIETTINGQRWIGHDGATIWFHTTLLLSLENNTGLFFSFNNPSGMYARGELIESFMNHYFPSDIPATIDPLPDHKSRVKKFIGLYRTTRFPYTSYLKAGELLYMYPPLEVKANDDGILILPGGLRLIEVEPLLFRPVNEHGRGVIEDFFIVFRENSQGKITYLFIHGISAFEKMSWFEDPSFHWGLLISCIIVLSIAFLIEPATFIVNKLKKKKRNDVSYSTETINKVFRWMFDHGKTLTRGLSFTISGLFILYLLLIIFIVVPITNNQLIWGVPIPLSIYIIFSIPIIGALFTGFMILFVGITWKAKYWELPKKIYYIIVITMYAIFLFELGYWNLLGFHF